MSVSSNAIWSVIVVVLVTIAVLVLQFKRKQTASAVIVCDGARRWACWVSYTFAATPIVWLILLYSFIARWRLFYGQWPDTSSKRMTIAIELVSHESLAGFFGTFMIFSFPIWTAFVLFTRHYILPASEGYKRAGLFFLPWILLLVLAFSDPGHYIMWFFN